jgi:hypothetical protein
MFGSGHKPPNASSLRDAMPRSWSHSMVQDSTSATMQPTISPKTPSPSSTRLSQERAFQEELRTHLRTDPHYWPYATEEFVERNRRLVRVWDELSLTLCFGHHHPQSWQQIPTATSTTTLTLTARDDDPTQQLVITPWPIRRQQVTLVYEGRYLAATFSNESKMREALKHAPWFTLQTVLFPNETE